ncbi:Hsp33 family molecular chaperone HslO [Gracilibacillus sp. S3-1-1]|uniref:Hsp33 family molecular chaperone HslO n=1 Tax=Gracilibacillus pellucidus TaxID=3095368 RepID=A0ACC6M9P3_9BACI|nr:Hsp33 family molecular chaperone HslO [Gracilibacillus sp. S3-1-1]MDX8047710.1 Hsp33 family molecular chaperone HslO [Gracilibacillus sp. S3-1-1]
MKDYLLKATAYNGEVRAYAIRSTETVEEARRRQDTWATTSAALGRTITISTMLGAMLKGEDKLTVKVEGNGPVGAVIADANAKGEVRGYVINPHVDFESNAQGKLDVRRAVGTKGTLSVVKDVGLKTNFTGQVPIVSGEISEDFTYYLATSEQVPSAVGAGVLVNPDHTILAAGGFIVQMMPGASETTIAKIEESINSIAPISTLIQEGKQPEEILELLLGKDNVKIHENMPVQFHCPCSKERMGVAIKGLGNDEIDAMIREDHGATASCHFCNETYTFSINDLQALKTE